MLLVAWRHGSLPKHFRVKPRIVSLNQIVVVVEWQCSFKTVHDCLLIVIKLLLYSLQNAVLEGVITAFGLILALIQDFLHFVEFLQQQPANQLVHCLDLFFSARNHFDEVLDGHERRQLVHHCVSAVALACVVDGIYFSPYQISSEQ